MKTIGKGIFRAGDAREFRGSGLLLGAVVTVASLSAAACGGDDVDHNGGGSGGAAGGGGKGKSGAGAGGASAGSAGKGGAGGGGGDVGESGASGSGGEPGSSGAGGSGGEPGSSGAGGSGGEPGSSGAGGSGGESGSSGAGGEGGGFVADCPAGTDTTLVGEIDASLTLYRACSPYYIESTGSSSVTFVGDETVVTVEAGVEIVVRQGLGIRFTDGARIQANGTSANPIEVHGEDAAPWTTLSLGYADSGSTTHELHYVTVRDAGQEDGNPERAAVAVQGGSATAPTELLADHLTIDEPYGVGISLYRDDYTRFAAGTASLVVRDAGSFPVSMSAQNLSTLPARQLLSSADPEKNVVAIDGGDDAAIDGSHHFRLQDIPLRLVSVSKHSVGTENGEGSLELDPGTVLEFGNNHFEFDGGSLLAVGTSADPIVFRGSGATGLIFDARTTLTSEASRLEHVTFDGVLVELYSATAGQPDECVDNGPVFASCSVLNAGCLTITGYSDAQFDVPCKVSDC